MRVVKLTVVAVLDTLVVVVVVAVVAAVVVVVEVVVVVVAVVLESVGVVELPVAFHCCRITHACSEVTI